MAIHELQTYTYVSSGYIYLSAIWETINVQRAGGPTICTLDLFDIVHFTRPSFSG